MCVSVVSYSWPSVDVVEKSGKVHTCTVFGKMEGKARSQPSTEFKRGLRRVELRDEKLPLFMRSLTVPMAQCVY